MNRVLLIAGAVFALVLCLALGVVAAAAAIFVTAREEGPRAAVTVQVSTAAAVTPGASRPAATGAPHEPGATGTPPAPIAASPTPDPETLAMLAEIDRQVAALRGLQPQGTFDLQFPTAAEYREITLRNFSEDYSPEEAADDARLFAALGLAPEGYDLYTLYVDLYSEGVLGSYDPRTKEMYVLQAGDRLGGLERQTYAHEYTHALQDQNFGMEALGFSDDGCERDSERCLALRGLIEGDALLLDGLWLETHGTAQDYADIADFYRDYSSPAYDRALCYLRDDFYWPYDDGARFVQGLYDSGGWAAVDAAYANPPISSEQIMHPERYHAGDTPEILPAPVLTETLGLGWRQIDAGVMGEWYTRLILLEPFRDPDPASPGYCAVPASTARQMEGAAAGWGGDAYVAYHNDEAGQTVFALLTTWDQTSDAVEFAAAFARYGEARFGGQAVQRAGGVCWQTEARGETCVFRRESDTLWVLAPDADTLDRVAQEIPPFAAR